MFYDITTCMNYGYTFYYKLQELDYNLFRLKTRNTLNLFLKSVSRKFGLSENIFYI